MGRGSFVRNLSQDLDKCFTKGTNTMRTLEIYTDGACLPNPGQGAWAFVVYENNRTILEKFGYAFKTTNNRMETQAVIECSKVINRDDEVTVFSDSSLVVNTYNLWMHNWEKKKFKGKKNIDLVVQLIEISKNFPKLKFNWIKGHSGVVGNERADELCGISLKMNWSSNEFSYEGLIQKEVENRFKWRRSECLRK